MVLFLPLAWFLDHHALQLDERATDSLGPGDDLKCSAYLRSLLGPPSAGEEQPRSGPSVEVPPRLRQMDVALLCKDDPTGVIPSLRYLSLGDDLLQWDDALRTCELEGVLNAVVWALDWQPILKPRSKRAGRLARVCRRPSVDSSREMQRRVQNSCCDST